MKLKKEIIFLLAIPIFIALGVAALFYPGAMSYDTLHALRSARNGVTDSMWPPMVSYVWRFVDLISTNPSAMHLSQLIILLLSIFCIIYFFSKRIIAATVFLLIYLSLPVILGTLAVIWKDVLMAAFFLTVFAILFYMKFVVNNKKFIFLSVLAVFIIFLGVSSRHNAITGAVPLIFYLAYIVLSRFLDHHLRLLLSVVLLSSVLTSAIFMAKIFLDKYSLPGLVRLGGSVDSFLQPVRVLDIAGASLCVGSNLFSDLAPNLTIEEIKSGYDPRHVNLSHILLGKVPMDNRINKIWLSVALEHPICFFKNKFDLTKYMIGADSGVQFLITHPSIDKNEYGYSFSDSSLRETAFAYIINGSGFPLLKPWVFYLIAVVSFCYLIWINALSAGYITLFLSAVSYFSSLVIFGNAADARLPFYTTTCFLIFIFLTFFEFLKRTKTFMSGYFE